jgi:hypothetical protein
VHEIPDGAGPAEAAAIAPRATRLLVWREDERVRYREPAAHEAGALERAVGGVSFGTLCDALARDLGEADAPAAVAGLLARWIADGCLRRTGG